MTEFIIVITATPSQEEAQAIAEAAIEQRLAAAVQLIGPIRSTFRWNEKIQRSEEWLCLLKTSRAFYQEVEQLIRALHSYELPGVTAVPIIGGSEPYLDWYAAQLKQAAP
jgi:periplasmic divalent cation tolerance protein